MNTIKMITSVLLFTSAVSATEIPLIGIDEKGEAIEESIGQGEFNSWMEKAIDASGSIIKTNPQLKTEEQAGLKLSQVDVGLGFKAQVGLGDVVKASIEPTVTFKFKRSK